MQLEPHGRARSRQLDAPTGRQTGHDHQPAAVVGAGLDILGDRTPIPTVGHLDANDVFGDVELHLDIGVAVHDAVGHEFARQEHR